MSQENTLSEKQQFWLGHIQACDTSGLSMKDYAQANALNVRGFYDSKRMLRRKGLIESSRTASSPLFRKVVVAPAPASTARVQLVSGVTLEVDGGVDPLWVGALVRALS